MTATTTTTLLATKRVTSKRGLWGVSDLVGDQTPVTSDIRVSQVPVRARKSTSQEQETPSIFGSRDVGLKLLGLWSWDD